MAAVVSSAPHRSIRGGPAGSPLLGRRLSRRDFVRSAGLAAVGLAAPFSFVRAASARTDRLHRYLQQKLTTCNTPSIAVAVVRGEEIVFADAVGWADKEHRLRATPQTLGEGKALFQTYCMVCHGEQGKGDGPISSKIPPPPSYVSDRLMQFPPGRIFHVITLGTGKMPTYASQLSADERWKVVTYVHVVLQGMGDHGTTTGAGQ